jgi:hypothetical protein
MLLQVQCSSKCGCYVCGVIVHGGLDMFLYFNSLNLRFSSVVWVFYVDSTQCLLQVHHFFSCSTRSVIWNVTDFVRECENFSVFLFLVIQCHCIKWPQSLVRFNTSSPLAPSLFMREIAMSHACLLQLVCDYLYKIHTKCGSYRKCCQLDESAAGIIGPIISESMNLLEYVTFWQHVLNICVVVVALDVLWSKTAQWLPFSALFLNMVNRELQCNKQKCEDSYWLCLERRWRLPCSCHYWCVMVNCDCFDLDFCMLPELATCWVPHWHCSLVYCQ